ncbi:MAG: universal stress protein [Gammaproteobacteria bacterium]|nr:universal stress protein [Gammaproteobacteria bacterium]
MSRSTAGSTNCFAPTRISNLARSSKTVARNASSRRLVDDKGVDLLVMGTLSRSGIPGMLIGNTAERVLNDVDCSVLTLKPKGFKAQL